MREKEKEEKIGDALLKVALGYQIAEVTEEYAEVDGEMKLTKRKKTKKDVPPDLKAVQLLLASEGSEEYGQWTDEQLRVERERLLAQLQAKQQEAEKKAEKKTTATKKSAKTTARKSVKTPSKRKSSAVKTKKTGD